MDASRSSSLTPGLIIRFLVLVAIVAGGAWLLLFSPWADSFTPRRLYELLQAIGERPGASFVFLGLWVLISVFGLPMTPLVLAGGAIFGFLKGGLLNYAGTLLGILVAHSCGRFLGYEFVKRVLGPTGKLLESALTNNNFWALATIRFFPVPFPVVNYGTALMGIPLRRVLAASALAYVPITMVWTYFATTLVTAGETEASELAKKIGLCILAMAVLVLVPQLIARRANKKR